MAHGAKSFAHVPQGWVVGAKAVLRAGDLVRAVVVAADAPPAATEPVRRLARERSLALVEVTSSEELGRRCGISRPVAAAAELRSA
jgi:ribosomal protein L7Ae-like RNA K-turn-binding protein